jgi:uncharacterized protein (TIGR02598 family)
VEVVLALGVVSFCLTSLIALLPVGLKTANSVWEEAAATSLLQQVSQGIRDAAMNSSGSYVGAGPCTNLSWTIGGGGITTNYFFTLGGVPLTSAASSRLTAQVVLTPPVSTASSGSALISVAWPQQAKWNTTTSSWSNAIGYVNTRVIFVPRQ